jgi:hypothetical protein
MMGLVVLVIMTLFAVSSMTDIGVQNNMVRNSQLEMAAYNNSLNEINAQIDKINVDNDEDILLEALNSPNGQRVLTDGSPILDENGDPVLDENGDPTAEDDEIFTDDGAFDVDVTMEYLRDQNLVPGYTLGAFRGLVYELDVDSTREGTATESHQVQGLYYVAPL